MNRFFTLTSVEPTQTDLTTWATTVFAQWNASGRIGDLMSFDFHLHKVEATCLTSPTAAQAIVTGDGAAGVGSVAVPNGVALVISFKIGRRYRGGHPRVYIPAMPQAALSGPNAWSTSTISAVKAAWIAFMNDVTSMAPAGVGSVTLINVSYFAGFHNVTFPSGRIRPVPTPRPVPVTDAIVGYSVNPKPASQRRRNLQSA